MLNPNENKVHPDGANSNETVNGNASFDTTYAEVSLAMEDNGHYNPENGADEEARLTTVEPYMPEEANAPRSLPPRPVSGQSRPLSTRSKFSMASRPISTRSGVYSRPISVNHIQANQAPSVGGQSRLASASSRKTTVIDLEEDFDVKSVHSTRLAEQGLNKKKEQERRIIENTRIIREKDEETRRFTEFIHNNFSCKECTWFHTQKRVKRMFDVKERCHCGEYEDVHPPSSRMDGDGTARWDEMQHIVEYRPTNAFGRIEFISDTIGVKAPAEFVRICDTNPIDSVLELMLGHWGMLDESRPGICISVISGSSHFELQKRKRRIFSDGLIKAAESTNAWIISSGLDVGINKIVGDAVDRHHSKEGTKMLKCIGIAPWGYVRNRNDLTNDTCSVVNPAYYKVSTAVRSGESVSLNPNHSHFILVDDGFRNRYSGSRALEYRFLLERQIALSEVVVDGDSGLGIPLVKVVVEGGYDVFVDAWRAVREGIPVVICDGTGRAANIIAFAARKLRNSHSNDEGQKFFCQRHHEELLQKVSESLGASMDRNAMRRADKMVEMCIDIVEEQHLVTVFDITRNNDLDKTILHALMKSQRGRDGDEAYLQQLRMTLVWDRPDIARDKIFKLNPDIDADVLDEVMWYAIVEEKINFIRLFLQNGVSIREFLTHSKLRELYSYGPRKCLFRIVMQDLVTDSDSYTLAHVRVLIRRLVGYFHNPEYKADDESGYKAGINKFSNPAYTDIDGQHFERPFNELFLWAVLSSRVKLARFFWERTDKPLTFALLATKIFRALSKWVPRNDYATREYYRSNKVEFEEIADGLLTKCQEVDYEKAGLLIERRVPLLDDHNCMETAAMAVDRKFIGNRVCQGSVDFVWNKGMIGREYDFLIAYLLPPLIFLNSLIRFQDPVNTDNRNEMGLCDKLYIFYTSPRVRFIGHFLGWIVFLGLFSALVLFVMEPKMTVLEGFIIAYMFLIIIDCLREFVVLFKITPTSRRYRVHGFTPWMWFLFITILLTIAGLILRLCTVYGSSFFAAKVLYIISGIFYFIRTIRFLAVVRLIGAKLVLITKMLLELVIFLVLLLVALLAYGVSVQALLYPTRPWSTTILRDIFANPFWQIFGEVFLDEVYAVKPGCTGNRLFASDGTLCPTYTFLAPICLAIYLVVAHVIFLNLLIAMFVDVYKEAMADSNTLWKFEWYFRVREFEIAPILPFPFSIFENIYYLTFHCLCSCLLKEKRKRDYEILTTDPLEMELRTFQMNVLRLYLKSARFEKQTSVSGRISDLNERIEELHRVVEEERLFALQTQGFGREVTVYKRPRSPDSHFNSDGSDGGTIVGKYSREKRRSTGYSTARSSARTLRTMVSSSSDSSLDAPVLPGYVVHESSEQMVTSGDGVNRRRVSLMDERLADLESTTSKSLLGIESLVRTIIEDETQHLSVSSYSSSVDSYSASDEEGRTRVVRRQRHEHRHEDLADSPPSARGPSTAELEQELIDRQKRENH